MTTYTEEACPFKDDCPDPNHKHEGSKYLTCQSVVRPDLFNIRSDQDLTLGGDHA